MPMQTTVAYDGFISGHEASVLAYRYGWRKLVTITMETCHLAFGLARWVPRGAL